MTTLCGHLSVGLDSYDTWTVRGTWDLVDGDFVQSGPLTAVGFLETLAISHQASILANMHCLLSFIGSPYFVAISGSQTLTTAEEKEMLEKIIHLCIGDDSDHEIVIIFQSQSRPSILIVQTSEAKLYALEVYCENGSFLPLFCKLAESPTFAVKSGLFDEEPGTEVSGSKVLSVLFNDRDWKNRITLYELQEKALKGVTRDCNAARLVGWRIIMRQKRLV